MPHLYSSNKMIVERLTVAKSLKDRTVGLLKYDKISDDQGLWILSCRSIHTFFMKFSIDVIFVDKKMRVVALVENVSPYKLLFPRWSADSVIEVNAGLTKKWNLEIGEVLRVVN